MSNNSHSVLLHSFSITQVLACIADPTKSRVIAEFSDSVSPVFPFLNAVFPNLMFNPGANTISIKRAGRLLTIYPRGASLAKIGGVSDAWDQLSWFQRLCNETWQRRAEITPCHERRKTLDPLDVYQLLPQVNCSECGLPTCWAFAWELLFGDLALGVCPRLSEPEHLEAGRRLQELLG